MVFQQFNLFPHLTVLENLTLAPIWVRKTPRKEAEETARYYLDRVKIPEQAEKYPGQLSGGQQQRVAIARSLRSEEHTSELQSLMRISYAVFCLKKKTRNTSTPVHKQREIKRSTDHKNK